MLTLELLKHGKKFLVTVGFDADTGLSKALEQVRVFPLVPNGCLFCYQNLPMPSLPRMHTTISIPRPQTNSTVSIYTSSTQAPHMHQYTPAQHAWMADCFAFMNLLSDAFAPPRLPPVGHQLQPPDEGLPDQRAAGSL